MDQFGRPEGGSVWAPIDTTQLDAARALTNKVQRAERRTDLGGVVYQLVFPWPLDAQEITRLVEHILHPWKVQFVEE